MVKIIQPLSNDDPAYAEVHHTEEVLHAGLEQASATSSNVSALDPHIDPTIDDQGIIRSMTIKPVEEHAIDLQSQIASALKPTAENNGPEFYVADFGGKHAGGTEVKPADSLIGGGVTLNPDAHVKSSVIQPQPQVSKTNIIVG